MGEQPRIPVSWSPLPPINCGHPPGANQPQTRSPQPWPLCPSPRPRVPSVLPEQWPPQSRPGQPGQLAGQVQGRMSEGAPGPAPPVTLAQPLQGYRLTHGQGRVQGLSPSAWCPHWARLGPGSWGAKPAGVLGTGPGISHQSQAEGDRRDLGRHKVIRTSALTPGDQLEAEAQESHGVADASCPLLHGTGPGGQGGGRGHRTW